MTGANVDPGQGETTFTTSFTPTAVKLPAFLSGRIPVLAPLVESLEKTPFVEMVDGELPAGIEAPSGMPEIPVEEVYSHVRAVSGTVHVVDGPTGVEAAAITFRNDDLTERAFAVTYDPATGQNTRMNRRIHTVKGYVTWRDYIGLYDEAMGVIGPLALSGSSEIPPELIDRVQIIPPEPGRHEGGLRYRSGSQSIAYFNQENFQTDDGGLGRNFQILVGDSSNAHMLLAEISGSTILNFDPPAIPPQP